jgi:hypothetical protein
VGQFEFRDKIKARKGNRKERTMRAVILALGALVVAAIILLWPPAVVNIWRSPYDATMTVRASIGVRAAIFVFAVATFIAAGISAVISALRHRA